MTKARKTPVARKAAPKPLKPRATPKPRVWNIHLYNGDWFAALTFTTQQVKALFKGARIEGDCVYLT